MSQVICHLPSQRWGRTWLTVKYEPPPPHPRPKSPPRPDLPHTHLCFEEDPTFLAVSRGRTKSCADLLLFHFVLVLLNRRKCRENNGPPQLLRTLFWLTLASFVVFFPLLQMVTGSLLEASACLLSQALTFPKKSCCDVVLVLSATSCFILKFNFPNVSKWPW